MRKRLLILLISLLLISASAYGMQFFAGGSSTLDDGGGGADYSDITFWLNAEENDTTGTYDMGSYECSDDDTSGTYYDGATISSGVTGMPGSYSFYFPDGSDYLEFTETSANVLYSTVNSRIGFYLRVETIVNTGRIFTYYVSALYFIRLRIIGTADPFDLALEWDEGDSYNITYDCDLSPDTTYFVELKLDCDEATDHRTLYINGTAYDDTTAVAGIDGTAGSIQFGQTNTIASGIFIDNVMISTDPDRDFYDSGSGLFDDTEKPSGACDG